ncbi:MAG: DEAD/DEAH box helicase [Chlorobiaceae bacterium]|nr:DEAD/DEAH box helicase [Chlorobiaceae bacterium]
MGGSQENTENLFENWILVDGAVRMKLAEANYSVIAAEIVRVEFKGKLLVDGISVNAKPSDSLPFLHFNRFPCDLKIRILMPSGPLQRPVLELYASCSGCFLFIEKVPESDQIIVGDDWYPLISENIRAIKELLSRLEIIGPGTITLRQALALVKEESSLILVETAPEGSDDICLSATSCEQALKLLSENGFQADLYPYQKNGFSWLRGISEEGLGCILADEMGLGKTMQVIAVLSYFRRTWEQPSLIVAPATLLENWRREFARFSSQMTVHVHSGNRRTGFPSQLKRYAIIVCSYDTVVRDQGLLGMIEWGFVVLDEAQAIKNPDTRRAIAVKGLKRRVAISVTGTPVENRLADLWSLMDFSFPGLLGSLEVFNNNYGDDYQSAEKLEKIVSPLMLRRRIADVATDLPEKIIISQPVSMRNDEADEYELIRQQVADEYGKSATLVSLLRLRQYCTHPILLQSDVAKSPVSPMQSSKFCRLLEILEEIVLNGQKAIIFTSFIGMSDLLCRELPVRFSVPSWQIDGRTPVEERQFMVDNFSGITGAAVLVLNPKAAGTGLNITAANHVIHYTLEWNPAVEDQATARAFRRGQTLPVTVHRLFYPNTVEEVINERLARKRYLAETAVVGTEASELDAADIARAIKLSPSVSNEGESQ